MDREQVREWRRAYLAMNERELQWARERSPAENLEQASSCELEVRSTGWLAEPSDEQVTHERVRHVQELWRARYGSS